MSGNCEHCGGDGWTVEVESYSEAAHAPDCQGYCRNCPVEVEAQRQVQVECPECEGTGRDSPTQDQEDPR